jgi:2-polyprenyl-3-methyl-5-hydroxy-6-metoxy-1,4-benzoquinol methylase
MSDSFTYPGEELVLFQHATNWKKYFSRQIKPYLKGNVLEAGAGIGSSTLLLNDGSASQWLMLEPDKKMFEISGKRIGAKEFPANCRLQRGTIDQLTSTFDTIIYIDVLEHIENDSEEIKKAAKLLNQYGHIIVLSPALNYLFSPFDKTIGHYRRYNRKMFRKISPEGLQLIKNRYYDSVGYFASLMNKLFLRQKYPTLHQVKFWDKWMVPVSKVTDKIFFHSFGKSMITVWKKKN